MSRGSRSGRGGWQECGSPPHRRWSAPTRDSAAGSGAAVAAASAVGASSAGSSGDDRQGRGALHDQAFLAVLGRGRLAAGGQDGAARAGREAQDPLGAVDEPREAGGELRLVPHHDQRQAGEVGDLDGPVRDDRRDLDEAVVGPPAEHHALLRGERRLGQGLPADHGIQHRAGVDEVPAERVHDHAEAQQVDRAATVEGHEPGDIGQVDDGLGERDVGRQPLLDGVHDPADFEPHGPSRSLDPDTIGHHRDQTCVPVGKVARHKQRKGSATTFLAHAFSLCPSSAWVLPRGPGFFPAGPGSSPRDPGSARQGPHS